MSDVIRVRIAHRSPLFQECLVAGLAKHGHFEVLGIDCRAGVERLSAEGPHPHVLVLDLQLPDRLALRWTEDAHRVLAHTKVLLLAPGEPCDLLFNCMSAGAYGCFVETSSMDQLRAAIDSIHRGRPYYCPQIVQTLFRRVSQAPLPAAARPRAGPSDLTRRELEVVGYIALDLSNKQIARRLHISLHTVKNHVHNIVDKLRVSNRRQAVEYARQRRWLPEPERQIVVGSALQPDERARPAGRPDLPGCIYRA